MSLPVPAPATMAAAVTQPDPDRVVRDSLCRRRKWGRVGECFPCGDRETGRGGVTYG